MCRMYSTEIGTLNTFLHLYEYKDYDHRDECRAASGSHPEWQGDYLKKSKQCMVEQKSAVYTPASDLLKSVGWNGFEDVARQTSGKEGGAGVYEFRKYRVKGTGVNHLLSAMETSLPEFQAAGGVLIFVGLCDVSEDPASVMVIWRYDSMQQREESRKARPPLSTEQANLLAGSIVDAPSICLAVPLRASPMQ
jgi:hypothetical protein